MNEAEALLRLALVPGVGPVLAQRLEQAFGSLAAANASFVRRFAAKLRTRHPGTRILLCARCDFEWIFWRGTCPFCECDEPNQQKYFVSTDQVYRLYTCARCHRYIKTIDLRQVADERLLPVERIVTLALDLAAHQMQIAA